MKIAFLASVALFVVTACAHHGGHHGSHRHHPYTHDVRDHADAKMDHRAAAPDPAPSQDYTETYSAPAARDTDAARQPAVTYSAPTTTYSYSSPAPTSTYTTTRTYTAAPTSTYTYATPQTYGYAAATSEAAQTGPDTTRYALGDTCMGHHANSSGPLIGNLTGGTRYTCTGGPVATSGGASYAPTSYNYSYSSAYTTAPSSTYSPAPGTRQTYTFIPGQPSSGQYGVVTEPPLQGAPEAPSVKPSGQ